MCVSVVLGSAEEEEKEAEEKEEEEEEEEEKEWWRAVTACTTADSGRAPTSFFVMACLPPLAPPPLAPCLLSRLFLFLPSFSSLLFLQR